MTQNSQYRRSEDIVEKIHRILGLHPGYRTLHADGRLFRGMFRANAVAREYTKAVHLQGDDIPVTVRFSKGGGDPFAHFNQTVGMATRFYLPDGRVTNLVMLSQKLFFSNTIEQFVALLESGLPNAPGGPINKEGLDKFLATNPNVRAVFKMRAESLAPISFAHAEFNSVHAFYYRNAADVVTPARCHWTPLAGIKGEPPQKLAQESLDVLFLEIEDRLKRETVGFDLVLELAEAGDPLNDATALWPEARRKVAIGRLTLAAPITEQAIGDVVMNHDPTMLTDGIEPTDDPILQIRRGVYEVSAAQRSGGWLCSPFGRAQRGE